MSDAYLTLEDLTLAYGGTVAADRLNLRVRWGKLIALLGRRVAARPRRCARSPAC